MSVNTLAAPTEGHVYSAARPNAANILRVVEQASFAEISEGLAWYKDAQSLARSLDKRNHARAAGVIAVLSPMMTWERNKMLARKAFAEGRASGAFGKNVAKANAILGGAEPLSVISGKKVTNFYRAIMGERTAVCIDRHAFDIALGRVTNDASRAQLSRKGVYENFAAAYSRAAQTLSERWGIEVTAFQVQAIAWVVWRRMKGIDW